MLFETSHLTETRNKKKKEGASGLLAGRGNAIHLKAQRSLDTNDSVTQDGVPGPDSWAAQPSREHGLEGEAGLVFLKPTESVLLSSTDFFPARLLCARAGKDYWAFCLLL